MFGLNSGIEFEPSGHPGLWAEEAACSVLVFEGEGVWASLRFSVALEAAAAAGLGAGEVRDRLRDALARDLEARLPDALGMAVKEREEGGTYWAPGKPVAWRRDALRRLGYSSLAPHGMCRLGAEPPPDGAECWRRTLR